MTINPILVVVPTCDRPAMLADALSSVIAQADADWVAVVADDGEQGPVGLPKDPRIHVVRVATRSPGGARNAAVEHGGRILGRSPDLVAFLDDDDLWLPPHLAASRRALAKDAGAAFVHGAAVTRGPSGESPYHERESEPMSGSIFSTLLRRNAVATSSVVVRGPALEEAGGFRTDLPNAQDWALWLELSRRAPVSFVPEVTVVYRSHETNRSRSLAVKNEAQARVLFDWWPRRASLSPADRRLLRHELARRRRRHVKRLIEEGQVPRRDVRRLAASHFASVPHPTALRAWIEAAFLPRGKGPAT